MLLCKDMRQGIFVLLIERATYPEKPNQIQFPKKNLQFLKPNPISKRKTSKSKNQTQSNFPKQKPNYPTVRKPHPTSEKPKNHSLNHQKALDIKNPVFSPGFFIVSEHSFCCWQCIMHGIFFDSHAYGFCKSFEDGFNFMVFIVPLAKNIQVTLGSIRE